MEWTQIKREWARMAQRIGDEASPVTVTHTMAVTRLVGKQHDSGGVKAVVAADADVTPERRSQLMP